jgi:hypothetical protein
VPRRATAGRLALRARRADGPPASARTRRRHRAGSRRDRCAGRLDVSPAVDQRSGHLDVVAARRPMQRRLGVPAPLHRRIGIGSGGDQHGHHLRPAGKSPASRSKRAGPSASLRGRPRAAPGPDHDGRAATLERLDVASAVRLYQLPRERLALRQPQPATGSAEGLLWRQRARLPCSLNRWTAASESSALDGHHYPPQLPWTALMAWSSATRSSACRALERTRSARLEAPGV